MKLLASFIHVLLKLEWVSSIKKEQFEQKAEKGFCQRFSLLKTQKSISLNVDKQSSI